MFVCKFHIKNKSCVFPFAAFKILGIKDLMSSPLSFLSTCKIYRPPRIRFFTSWTFYVGFLYEVVFCFPKAPKNHAYFCSQSVCLFFQVQTCKKKIENTFLSQIFQVNFYSHFKRYKLYFFLRIKHKRKTRCWTGEQPGK